MTSAPTFSRSVDPKSEKIRRRERAIAVALESNITPAYCGSG